MEPYFKPDKSKMTDAELIEELKQELRRVKMQRNDYEQKLLMANRELNRVSTELKLLENYINRRHAKNS